jgi:NitT/TauT family transport system permease protein/taurine transport system permease protein
MNKKPGLTVYAVCRLRHEAGIYHHHDNQSNRGQRVVLRTANEVSEMKKQRSVKLTMISCCSFACFILIWWLATDGLHLFRTNVMPSPVAVVLGFFKKLTTRVPDGGLLHEHFLASLQVATTGFLLGVCSGIPIGICTAWYPRFGNFFQPIFNLFRPMPAVAWIPIFVLWFGIGLAPKVALVFISAFIPSVINANEGIRRTSPVHLWVARTFGASRTQMLFTVAIPTALPAIFTALRITLAVSWGALAAAELIAATAGLGNMIQANRNLGNIDLVVVGMLALGAIGSTLSYGVAKLEKKFVKGRMSE